MFYLKPTLMKTKNLLSIACVALLAFSGCSNDDGSDFNGLDKKYIKFDAGIESQGNAYKTRASGTTWGSGDAIGIYMTTAGASLTTGSIVDNANNIKHTTPGDGVFSAATTGIKFPTSGSVDFIAYYPYQTSITGYAYPINVADQSDLAKIDLLYSNNAKNASKTSPTVALDFKHKLSQLVLNITAGDGISSLSGLSLSVSGLITDGSFNLTNAAITKGSTKTTFAAPVKVTTGAVVNAILVPGDNLSNGKLTFALSGKTYEWTPASQVLDSGKKYTYSIQISTTGVVVVNPSATIQDWEEGNTGVSDIVLTPTQNDVFTADNTTVSLAAAASTSTIELTTQTTEAWTATSSDATWLTVTPANGTGSGTITLTATANTAAARTATITLTPTSTTLSAVTITVTQAAGGSITPSVDLAFAGSDFSNWADFIGGLDTNGLKGYASEDATSGRNGSAALYINGAPTSNDFIFTSIGATPIPSGATKIVLYIKGTASAKSLSFNLYSVDGPAGTAPYKYFPYNLGVCTGDTDISSTASTNSYAGTIDTNGQWVKVTLDISGKTLNTTGNIFALKVGKDSTYDLRIDSITFE